MMPTPSLYLSVCIRNFAVQSCLRFRQHLIDHPIALIEDLPSLTYVSAINRRAAQSGISIGMSSMQASLVRNVIILQRSYIEEQSTSEAIVEICARFTPRIEEWSHPHHLVLVLDIKGCSRLFVNEETIARRILNTLRSLNVEAHAAVSTNFHTARLIAETCTDLYRVISPGSEQESLSRISVDLLLLTGHQRETLSGWGIYTLRDLAALPIKDFVSRLGLEAVHLQEMAQGCHPHTFTPRSATVETKESVFYDSPVDRIDSLLFTIAALLRQLIQRAEADLQALAALTLVLHLDNDKQHVRTIRPGRPSLEHKLLLKLIQLDLELNPPSNNVTGLTLSSGYGRVKTIQHGLFTPELPEASQLELTLARIRLIVGDARFGSVVAENSHQPGPVTSTAFTPAEDIQLTNHTCRHHFAMRRVQSTVKLHTSCDHSPLSFIHDRNEYHIKTLYGPWKTTSRWWNEDRVTFTQWDVKALTSNTPSALYCCLLHNEYTGGWTLEGIYD